MNSAMAKLSRLPKGSFCLSLLASLALAGCSGGDSSSNAGNTELEYQVQIINLTAGQPLSPVAVIAHDDNYRMFSIGDAASSGLEVLAEGGDNSGLIDEASAAGAFAHASGDSPVAPGATDTLTVTIDGSQQENAEISVVTMLVNTNDAFTGVSSIDVSGLGVGVDDSVTLYGVTYDSGTEANSEAAGTIPGPADGGEGFKSARDDIADQVTMHGGVVTVDDGLDSSVLTQQHKWDNPAVQVKITRQR
ncbi:MAG: spondin domain-containing protein [Endozoicomonas sp.]